MTFVEMLTFRGIRWRRNVSKPGEIALCCPFCGDTRYRLGLNPARNVAHCYNCEWASRHAVAAFLRKLSLSFTISDAGRDTEEKEPERTVELPNDFTPLNTVHKDDDILWDAKRYLLRRGITRQQIHRHHLGVTLTGRFAWRVVMPVVYRNELRGLVARDFTGRREPKYLNSTGRKSIWNCRRAQGDVLHLAEGIFKAMAIERVLGVQAGALLGHSVTEDQVEQILEQGYKRVVLWSDPDRPGIEGTISVAERLQEYGVGVALVHPIPHDQADEMTEELLGSYGCSIKQLSQSLMWKLKLEVANR